MRRLLAILTFGLAVACAPTPPTPSPSVSSEPSTSPSSSASPTAEAATGILVVRQRKTDSGLYTEGAVAFLEIRDEAGQLVNATETPNYHLDAELLRADLPPGRYTIGSHVRPCEAACPAMDPPTDGCSLELAIEPGATVHVLVERRVAQPCAASVLQR